MKARVSRTIAAIGTLGLAGFAAGPAMAQSAPAPAAPAPAAAPAAPAAVSLLAPGMNGPLSFPSNPYSVDVGPLGKWYVDGAVTGLAFAQSSAVPGDSGGGADLSNGQVFLQKVDGWWQFYAQAGAYSIPVLGAAYKPNDAKNTFNNYYGIVPQAFLKLVPTDSLSLLAGKLPTLIGAESTFSFENFNIERGLLWNQEPAVSKGAQATYVQGPVTVNLSVNDGYYSNRYNWISGSAAWAINATNTLTVDGAGNLGKTASTQFATPTPQNNSSIFNVIYTYNNAPWIVTPYVQVQTVNKDPTLGLDKSITTYGGALLVSYTIDSNWSIGARGEYLNTGSKASGAAPNLLYGPGSDAWSLTITPTYQYNRFFARLEGSLVDAGSITEGFGFGSSGTDKTQFRVMAEGGVLF